MNVNKLFGIFLITIVVIVVGLVYFLQIPEKLNLIKPRPSSTPLNAEPYLADDAIKIKEEITKTDKKVGDVLLADNDKFKINYLISNDQFSVIIQEDPFVDNKKEAEQWFLGKGFKQADLCLFRIYFVPGENVTHAMSAADTVPTNCDVPAIDGLAPSDPTQ